MFPSRFAYARPNTWDEAVLMRAEHADDSLLLAGGQSLIPLMKLRLVFPEVLIDLNGIAGLAHIGVRDGMLSLGPMVRHAQVERDPRVQAHTPLIAAAVHELADVQVRNLGTVAGSLAEADPSGDWGPALLALGGEVVCRSVAGTRVVDATRFFVDYLTSALNEDELIEDVRLRIPDAHRSGHAYAKLERRGGDFAVVCVAAQLTVDEDGRCADIGLGCGGVGLTPVKPVAAEAVLRGSPLDAAALDDAADALMEDISPVDDGRGPADYKREMAKVYLKRAVRRASQVAQVAGSEHR